MNRTISLDKLYNNYRDDLFFCAYLCLFLSSMIATHLNLGDSVGNLVNYTSRGLYIIFIGLCALSLILRKTYSAKELILIGGLLILGILSYYFSGAHYFFDFVLMVSIAKNIDFKRFMRRAVILLALFIFAIVCLSLLDIISPVVRERSDNTQMRNSLGFISANMAGIMIFELIAGIIVLERNRLKAVHLWLLLGLGVIIYWITKSQSCLIGVSLLVAAALIYKFLARKMLTPRQMKIFFGVVLIALAVVAILLIRYYWGNPDSLSFSTLSGRITLAQKYLDAYGVRLFGQEILLGRDVALPGYAAGYSYLDNGEVWYLVQFGIVGCVIFFYTYVRMIVKTVRTKEFVLCIVAVVYLIYSLTENVAFRVPCNFMILYAAMSLYGGNFLTQEQSEDSCGMRIRYTVPHDKLSGIHHEQSS